MEESQFGSWSSYLTEETTKPYFLNIRKEISKQLRFVCPIPSNVFKALRVTALYNLRVVIVGQDPYIQMENGLPIADGIAFSTWCAKTPNSLSNLRIEIDRDMQYYGQHQVNVTNDLSDIASTGVLLLNTHLTANVNATLSHYSLRWDLFTGRVLEVASSVKQNIVFVLMGSEAQDLGANWIRNRTNHLIIETTHPTTKSFKYGSKALWNSSFASRTNTYLEQKLISPIDWTLL